MPDKCQCIDFQLLKLQEAPELVPHGEMPKHIELYCDRYIHLVTCVVFFFLQLNFVFRNLVDRAMPGNKITLVGIYCIKRNVAMNKVKQPETKNFQFRIISLL